MGQREAGHIGKCREASRFAVRREVGRIVGCRDLIRREQEGVAPRRQAPDPRRQAPDPHNHAHKMRGESQLLRQIRK